MLDSPIAPFSFSPPSIVFFLLRSQLPEGFLTDPRPDQATSIFSFRYPPPRNIDDQSTSTGQNWEVERLNGLDESSVLNDGDKKKRESYRTSWPINKGKQNIGPSHWNDHLAAPCWSCVTRSKRVQGCAPVWDGFQICAVCGACATDRRRNPLTERFQPATVASAEQDVRDNPQEQTRISVPHLSPFQWQERLLSNINYVQ